MDDAKKTGKVVIISYADSFLANSLIRKLSEAEIQTEFSHADVKELEKHTEGMELAILFAGEELDKVPDALVYLKDYVQDKGLGLMLIGDDESFEVVNKTIPETAVMDRFKRPIDIGDLVKKIGTYLDENTGEKRKKNILIVDDDITYMRTVYEWLKDDFHVGMASNGVQAIGYLAKNKADLILLDYEMPIANGPQVLSMLKSDADTERIPVMFLTGHGEKESVLSVMDLNPEDYILKTIDKAGILKKLKTFFAKSK